MDATASTTSAHARRVLPSRNRRGGPNVGIGNCEADLLILDSYKRQHEAGPIVPLDTPFLLTTNSKHAIEVPGDSGAPIRVNIFLNDSHFARPEVLKACREQEIIQTPDFESIAESSSVGGRMRPRGAEDESAETSDAAYEKRHRKFETFEKRQRLREKEKLRHEHYKLKERIEQLKSMESSAFMALPASSFTPPPVQAPAELDEIVAAGSPYAHINGMASHAEGERRRKEMLENAYKLEKRYAYLLPPDRVRKTQDDSSSSKKPIEGAGDESETERTSTYAGTSRKEAEGLKLRLPARSSASTTPAPSPSASRPPATKKTKGAGSSKQSASRLRREGLSTPLSATAPLEQHEFFAPSLHVDVEMLSPEPIRVLTPAPLMSAAEVAIPHIPLLDVENVSAKSPTPVPAPAPEPIPYLQNGSVHPAAASPVPPSTEPLKEMDKPIDMDVEMDDGESEKAPSDNEAAAPEEPEPQAELQPISLPTPELVSAPTPEPAAVAEKPKKKRGRKPKKAVLQESEGIREISTRLEQTTVADEPGPSGLQESEIDQEATENLANAPIGPEFETISATRPRKKRKNARADSVGTPSVSAAPTVTAEPQSTASSRKPRFYGGHRHYQKFTNSAGELEVTTSSLIIAALLKGQRNSSLRHGTAFGVKVSEAYFMKERDFDMPFIADFDRDSSFPSNNLNGTGPRVVNPAFHGPAPPPPPAPVAVEVPSIETEVEAEPQEETSEEKHTEEDVQMEAPEPEQVEQADHREQSLPEVTTLEPTVLQQQDEDAIQVDEHEGPNIEATQDMEEKTDGTTPIDQLEPEEETQQADPVAELVNADVDVDGDEEESAPTSPTVDTEPEDTRIKPRILSVPADPDEEELEW